ncbi:MAG: hypothetical protein ACYTXY_33585, partial [Nostoc sp.]
GEIPELARQAYKIKAFAGQLVAQNGYATPCQVGQYPSAIVNNFDNQFISALLGQQALKQAILKAENEANQQIRAMD